MLKTASVVLVVGTLTGCSVVTLHPVAGDQAASYDGSLAGNWQVVGETDVYRISQADEHTYRYCEIKEKENLCSDCCGKAQLLKVGSDWFADLVPDSGIVPLHLIAKVQLAPGEIRIAILNKVDPQTPLRQEIIGQNINQQLILTASTTELQSALPKLAAFPGAFGDQAVLLKIKQ